jgi:hypothetical protein
MKQLLTIVLTVVAMTALAQQKTDSQVATAALQPLLKTHVETGYVEGVLDGSDLAVVRLG